MRPTVTQHQQMWRQLDVAEAALWRVVELAPTTERRRAERLCWRIKYLRTNVLDAMVDAHGTGPRSEPAPRSAGVCPPRRRQLALAQYQEPARALEAREGITRKRAIRIGDRTRAGFIGIRLLSLGEEPRHPEGVANE